MSKSKIQSSLKNINFDELTAEEIIKKYEQFLDSREKQVFELSSMVGQVTQKLENLKPKYEDSKDKNAKLKIILQKKEELLKQELENKEIMFMQLSNKEKEYDEIQQKIKDFKNNKNNKNKKNQKDSNKDDKSNNKEEKENKKEDKKDKDDKEKNKVQTEVKEQEKDKEKEKEKTEDKKKDEVHDPKSLAREKINQLTNKSEGMKKLNFAELLKKNQ